MLPAPRRIGPYELIEELGHGGMGVVYRARHVRLGTCHAVKLISAGEGASEEEVRRFAREASAVARMGKHPNIVTIHDLGEEGGRVYYAMELVEGRSLGEMLDRRMPTPEESARLTEKVARALHFAHQRGVVHRDVKPQNILLREDGEPQLTDFGLARDFQSGPHPSESGEVMGTIGYMAPEQALGRTERTDARTDVYAMGAVLYEMLTGEVPHRGRSRAEMLATALEGDIVPPGNLHPHLPPDLETIVMTCLARDPARRYASAGALAEDLERWRSGRPIAAWAVSRADEDEGLFRKGWSFGPETRDRLDTIVSDVTRVLKSLGHEEELLHRTEQVVRELGENAIDHGCRGREWGRVHVEVTATRGQVQCVVGDDGPGYNFAEALRREMEAPPGRMALRGHGLLLVRRLADRLGCAPPGNSVTAVIRRRRARLESETELPAVAAEVLLLTVRGILDSETAGKLQQRLDSAIRDGRARRIVVDLLPCTFLSSAGAGTLAEAADRVDSIGGRLVVVATGRILETLRVLGVDEVLCAVPNREEARKAVMRDPEGPGLAPL